MVRAGFLSEGIGRDRGKACGVDAILLWEGRQVGDDVIPLGITLLALAFTPEIGNVEAILPVGQFEGMVIAEVLRHGLLHGGNSLEMEKPRLFVIADEVGHERRSSLYLFSVCLECFGRGIGTIHLFSEIDVVGVLPDEEGANIRRSLASPGIGHLHPADSLETLTLGYLTGDGVGCLVIPFEHLL